MNPRLLLAIAAILMVGALVFVGCSGSGGPRLPAPVSPERPDPNRVHLQSLIVPGGETMRVEQDTVYVVEETVIIDGELIGADGSGAGAHGVDITIEAEGDISVTGLVQAGSGTDGASDEAGGDGGSVSLTSTGGSITIGAEDEVAAASSGKRGLHAGDAGAGGEGLLGGAGGKGGSVVLACASGKLTIHEAPGLFHVGNGGHGGQGVVGGEDLATFEPPAHLIIPIEETGIELPPFDGEADGEEFEMPIEVVQLPSHGGDSGRLAMNAEELIGPETEEVIIPDADPVFLVFSSIELVSGAAGGNAGSFTLRSEAVGDAALRAQSSESASNDLSWFRGADGGDGERQGGDGGDIDNLDRYGAYGGKGGSVDFNPGFFSGFWYVHRVVRAGRGGDATSTSSAGSDGSDCRDGRHSRRCLAWGGSGGRIRVPHSQGRSVSVFPGRGGHARATSGPGGQGGDCCDDRDPGPGGAGGNSGDATARGGAGSFVYGFDARGRGGDAAARTGKAGDGGNGDPPGGGGKAGTATAMSFGGEPEGAVSATNGMDGNPGDPCPDPEPDPEPTPEPEPEPTPGEGRYGVTVHNSEDRQVDGHTGFYTPGAATRQLQPGFSLSAAPLIADYGRNAIFNPDNSRLWTLDLSGGARMYSDPLSGGNRGPEVVLSLGTPIFPEMVTFGSFHYEFVHDIVYAARTQNFSPQIPEDQGGAIYAWDGASAGPSSRLPDRTIEVPGLYAWACLAGEHGHDRMFVAGVINGAHRVVVYDNAHQADGAQAPDRVLTPSREFRTTSVYSASAASMAWDAQRDLLYLVRDDGLFVDAYAGASTQAGPVSPARSFRVEFPGMLPDDEITGMVVMPEDDLIFFSMLRGQVLVFRNASALTGAPAPDRNQWIQQWVLGLGVFRQ